MKKGTGCLLTLLIFVVLYSLSWIVTVGLIYLVTLCFGWTFNLTIATGVWLIMCLLRTIFCQKDK